MERSEVLADTEEVATTPRVALTLRVSKDAKRGSQRVAVAEGFVADDSWRRFAVSSAG